MAGRYALLIASYKFDDPGLAELGAPAHDAESFARVLSDPSIGDFDVKTVIDRPHHEVMTEIEGFLADRHLDDLLLLYFSGHGVKDQEGRLFFAMPNTDRNRLKTTSVPATFVHESLKESRPRINLLILDCCYSGAYPMGMSAKADPAIGTEERFRATGRVVLAASDAMQYSFEGEDASRGASSLFTRYLVDGLESGEADRDEDGDVDPDELFEYVHDGVIRETPWQRPVKSAMGVQGRIVVAHNPRSEGVLPEGLKKAVESPHTGVRRGAVDDLQRLLLSTNAGVRAAAELALRKLADDDSKTVAEAAARALRDYEAHTQANTLNDDVPPVEAKGTAHGQEAEAAPAEGAGAGQADGPEPLANERRKASYKRAALLGVPAACVVAGAIVAVALTHTGGGHNVKVIGMDFVKPDAIAITNNATVDVADWHSGEVIPVSLKTDTEQKRMWPFHEPDAIAITPNGTMAYVANQATDTVTPVYLDGARAGTLGGPIRVGKYPDAIAATNTHVYVANQGDDTVTPVDIATGQPGKPIAVGAQPVAIAVAGDTVYVANRGDGTVTPITLPDNQAGAPITVGKLPAAIAIAGNTAYVARQYDAVTPINLSTDAAGMPITVRGRPVNIVVSPNGKTAYVADWSDGTVTPIDLATNRAGTPLRVWAPPGKLPPDVSPSIPMAIASSGATAYLVNYLNGDLVQVTLSPG